MDHCADGLTPLCGPWKTGDLSFELPWFCVASNVEWMSRLILLGEPEVEPANSVASKQIEYLDRPGNPRLTVGNAAVVAPSGNYLTCPGGGSNRCVIPSAYRVTRRCHQFCRIGGAEGEKVHHLTCSRTPTP